jgi:hypothetical protein
MPAVDTADFIAALRADHQFPANAGGDPAVPDSDLNMQAAVYEPPTI